MKLSKHEAELCLQFSSTVAGTKFQEFLKERRENYLEDLGLPESVGDFFEREQMLGRINELKTLVADFTQLAKQYQNEQ